ncbi:MAG: beta-N-acetylhexosaminidase [Ginsengibacter sp.]
MKKIILLVTIFITFCATAQTNITIVPRPVELTSHEGTFHLNHSTVILAPAAATHDATMLNHYLKKFYGFSLPVRHSTAGKATKNAIILDLVKPSGKESNEYDMTIDDNKIDIEGVNDTALFYGIQTLLQLMPAEKKATGFDIPQVSIKDYPRFQYRGMHLDVSRHFFGVDDIKKYIDFLAYQKFNTFHWHLTDDQGWRIEIKRYPKLTSVGAYRNGTIIGHYPGTGNDGKRYGGFYTQDQVKEIVKYAKDRYITIIPEIEMPGHSSAAIAAYPQLSCFPNESTPIPPHTSWSGSKTGKHVQQTWGIFTDVYCPSDYTFHFLENVLDEVMKLFPSKYIHIGGDECPKDNWKRSAFCQKLIKEKGLKDEEGLQSYFISTIEKYINSKGRAIIGWDEILEGGLAPNATVMSWRGEKGGVAAATQHHNVIMTPQQYTYIQQPEETTNGEGGLPLEKVYNYEPVPSELTSDEAKYVLGAQGCFWTEYCPNMNDLEYKIFPRLSALSEVFWSPKESKDFNTFSSELPGMYKRYQLWGTNYHKE